MRAGNMGVPTTSEWLNDALAPGCRVGIDPVSSIQSLILCLSYSFNYLTQYCSNTMQVL